MTGQAVVGVDIGTSSTQGRAGWPRRHGPRRTPCASTRSSGPTPATSRWTPGSGGRSSSTSRESCWPRSPTGWMSQPSASAGWDPACCSPTAPVTRSGPQFSTASTPVRPTRSRGSRPSWAPTSHGPRACAAVVPGDRPQARLARGARACRGGTSSLRVRGEQLARLEAHGLLAAGPPLREPVVAALRRRPRCMARAVGRAGLPGCRRCRLSRGRGTLPAP